MTDILQYTDLANFEYASASPTELIVKSGGVIYTYEWNGDGYELCK